MVGHSVFLTFHLTHNVRNGLRDKEAVSTTGSLVQGVYFTVRILQ